ncbi:phosphoribosyltransferase, partial [Candidatus Micrarchaeota archaeon]|nr:phosphoribosyltransferase [Candidatus Micrarchaeota archaeon]
IVGIGRGGLVPACYLADYLGPLKTLATLRIEYYTGIAKVGKKPKITQPVTVDLKGKNVLIVDDVADTGVTLKNAKEYIYKKGASKVKIAVLHYKPWSVLKPDYYVEETKKWVIYPWMRKESLEELKEKGENLEKTGIGKEIIYKLLEL